MKKTWVIVLVIAIVVICVGGWFGLNIYAQQRAKREVVTFLKMNHMKKYVTYKALHADIFSRYVSVTDVKYTVENNFTGEKSGYFTIDRIVFSGNPHGSYKVVEYGIKYINQNPKLKGLLNKVLFSIYSVKLETERKDNKKLESEIKVKDLTLNMPAITKALHVSKGPVFDIVKFNNPIDMKLEYKANLLAKTLKLDEYSIDFENNMKISYSCLFDNLNFSRLESDAKALKKSGGIKQLGDLIDTLSSARIEKMKLELKNKGILDRLFAYLTKKSGNTREEMVDNLIQSLIKKYPGIFGRNVTPLKKFLMSREDELEVKFVASPPVSFKDLFADANKMPFYRVLEKDFAISFEN